MRASIAQQSCRSSRWLDGLGAIIGCSGMVIAAFSGAVGAAATGLARSGSKDAMAGMAQSSTNPGWVNAINSIAQALLIVSLALVIVGLVPRGALSTFLAVIGSIGFYSFMFIHYSLPLSILCALVLASAYAVAFAPRCIKERRSSTSTTPVS